MGIWRDSKGDISVSLEWLQRGQWGEVTALSQRTNLSSQASSLLLAHCGTIPLLHPSISTFCRCWREKEFMRTFQRLWRALERTFPEALESFAHLHGTAAGLAVRMSTRPHGRTPQTSHQPKKQALLLIPICSLVLFVMEKK